MLKPISFILAIAITLIALHPVRILVKNLCPYLMNQLMRSANL